MAGNSAEAGRSVTSKVIAILMAFRDGTTLSLTEIAEVTGLPLSTVHRLTTELAAWGMLERTSDRSFQVGFRLQAMGAPVGRDPDLRRLARPVMEDVSAATRAGVRLGVLTDSRIAYIEFAGGQPVPPFSASSRLPGHATAMGKALLAFSAPPTVDRVIERGLLAYTPYTLTSPKELRRALVRIRESGVAVSRWELKVGLSSVAVPIFGRGGHVAAALEMDARDLSGDLPTLQAALTVAARGLSRDLATMPENGRTLLGAGSGGFSHAPVSSSRPERLGARGLVQPRG